MNTRDQLKQVSEYVWLFPADKDPSKVQPVVGAIITRNHTLLVDSGNSPAHALRVQSALDAIDAPPVSHIVYTHHHWDHVFGAQVFDAPVIAHSSCYAQVEGLALLPWGPAYLQERGEEIPHMAGTYRLMRDLVDWDTFRITLPTQVFSAQVETLLLDGLEVRFEHVGGSHASDSTVVSADDVMFLGDCYYPPAGREYNPARKPDHVLLARLLDQGLGWYVGGHNDAYRRDAWLRWLESERG